MALARMPVALLSACVIAVLQVAVLRAQDAEAIVLPPGIGFRAPQETDPPVRSTGTFDLPPGINFRVPRDAELLAQNSADRFRGPVPDAGLLAQNTTAGSTTGAASEPGVSSRGPVGAVRGTVQDADFLVPLPGVSIVVEGTGLGAKSDENGNFTITGLAAGNYALMVSKSGYVRARASDVIVVPGQVRQVNVNLTGEVVELDEYRLAEDSFVETTTIVEALSIGRDLKTFTEVLGAEFFTRTGASDVAKALTKAVGVNVAEGKFVVVRGLNDRYNSVTLNGLRVPSSDPDRRAVALDLFPAAVVKDIRTSKTFLPDMPGESTGANIDIVTKSVPDKDFYKFKIGLGYNTNATGNNDFLSYRGGGTGLFGTAREQKRALPPFIRNNDLPVILFAGPNDTPADRAFRERINRTLQPVMGTLEKEAPLDFSLEASMGHRIEDFMGAPAGLTIAVDYAKKYGYDPDAQIGRFEFNPAPGPFQGTVSLIKRRSEARAGQETLRSGILVSLGLEPDPDSEITATYFFNRLAEDRAALQFGIDPDQNPGVLDYRESIAYTERQLQVLQIEGKHQIDGERDATVNWAAAYNQSHQLEPDHRFVNARVDEASGQFFQPPFTAVPPFQRFWRELYDRNYSVRLDIDTDLFPDMNDDEKVRLKTGMLLDYSDRRYRADSFAYNPGFDNQGFPAFPVPAFPPFYPGFEGKPKEFAGQTWGDVLLSGRNVPVDQVGFAPLATLLYRANPVETYYAEQIISAGYGMFNVDMGPDVNLVFGARVESTDLKTQATPIYIYPEEPTRFALLSDSQRVDPVMQQLVNDAFNGDPAAQQDPRIVARSRANITRTDLLPAVALSWDFQENQRLRVAASRTIARPSFKEISPVAFLNVETGDIFVGNVDLKLSSIVNYDARWEWFPDPSSLIAVSLFSKSIDDPIELGQQGDFVKFINAEEGHVFGFELEFQRNLDFITEELRHWNIGANYSYIQSSATRPTFAGTQSIYGPSRRLQGQPDYILNFNLSYENPDSGLSAGLFLNVVGPQLYAVSTAFQDPDIFQKPFSTLDFALSKRFGKHGKLTFRAANLLNSEIERYYNNSQRPVYSTRSTGITYSASMELNW